MHAKNPQQIRITSPNNLPYAQIEHDLKDGHHVIVQFFEHTYTDSLLSEINHLCAKYDKNFGVRFFGHYTHFFDCDTLLKIPDVKCLYVDSLQHAVNTHAFSKLNALKKLSIGIYNLEDKEILAFENFKNLEDLILTETKTTSLNLDYLKEYKNLIFLIIGGHTKNIKAIGALSELQFLSLNSVKKVPISFVNNLEKLKTLSLFLGSRDNLNEIGETQIEHLDLVRVRGFNDLSKIERFKKIKTLHIEDQIQIKNLTFHEELPNLEELELITCKTLETLEGLIKLPRLHKVRIYDTAIAFSEFMAQKMPPSLKTLSFQTGKSKLDTPIAQQLESLGYSLK